MVADLLRMCGGALELVDVSDQLPDLKRSPGIKTWKVMDKYVMLAAGPCCAGRSSAQDVGLFCAVHA